MQSLRPPICPGVCTSPGLSRVRALVERLLNKRLFLRGICRALGVCMTWLMGFLVECHAAAPAHLDVYPRSAAIHSGPLPREAEADKLCSFVGKKASKQWLWLALDARSRQILAFHVADRSRNGARQLGDKRPGDLSPGRDVLRGCCAVYGCVIPRARHRTIPQSGSEDRSREPVQRHLTAAAFAPGVTSSPLLPRSCAR
jgi:hypothetical protein